MGDGRRQRDHTCVTGRARPVTGTGSRARAVLHLALASLLGGAVVATAPGAAALSCAELGFVQYAHGVPVPDVVDVAITPDEGSLVFVGRRGHHQVDDPHPSYVGAPASRLGSVDWMDGIAPDLVRTDDRSVADDAEAARRGNEEIRGLSLTPTGLGFWMFSSYGRVFPFGDAVWFGDLESLAIEPDLPVAGGVATTTGAGYWLFAGDGGIFAFGDAAYHGSVPEVLPGVVLDAPVVAMAPSPTGDGYSLVAADGGMFTFGDAPFLGSLPGIGVVPVEPVVDMIAAPSGYVQMGADGGTFVFGAGAFAGSIPMAHQCGRLSYWPGVGEASVSGFDFVAVDVLATADGYVVTDTGGWTYLFGRAVELAPPS